MYEIVCPDGKVRHFPYTNQGDAVVDARVADNRCQFYPTPNEMERALPRCRAPGHWVRKAERQA